MKKKKLEKRIAALEAEARKRRMTEAVTEGINRDHESRGRKTPEEWLEANMPPSATADDFRVVVGKTQSIVDNPSTNGYIFRL